MIVCIHLYIQKKIISPVIEAINEKSKCVVLWYNCIWTNMEIFQPLKCPKCSYLFYYKRDLVNVNENSHIKIRPFECYHCQRKFTRKAHLQRHMSMHTGEKPYQCTFCERKFSQICKLKVHLRVHTGDKPYQCIYCGKKFSYVYTLRKHINSHTGYNPYPCTQCSAKFYFKHQLKNHIIKNHNLQQQQQQQQNYKSKIATDFSLFSALANNHYKDLSLESLLSLKPILLDDYASCFDAITGKPLNLSI
jgi:uncharacterized Zn-finger protein